MLNAVESKRSVGNREHVRVVLADDDTDMRRVLSTLLTQEGIDVVGEAGDGEKAIELVGELRPDVVVMDLMIPTLGGADAAREIAARWPSVTIAGLTAGDSSAHKRLLEAGSHVVFDKTDIIQVLDWFAQKGQLDVLRAAQKENPDGGSLPSEL